MEGVRTWLLAVTAAALLAAAAEQLAPEGAARRGVRLVCGLMLLAVMLRPLSGLLELSPRDLFAEERAAAQASVRGGTRAGEEQLSELIARETGAYIVDKAAALGAECSARVTCGRTEEGLLLPVAAEVTGALTPAQREELARLMEEELGIPEENQTYQGGEDG